MLFKRSVVLRRLVLGIEDKVAQSSEAWGEGSFVCGQLKARRKGHDLLLCEGRERWCRGLDLIAEDAKASKRHGAGADAFREA